MLPAILLFIITYILMLIFNKSRHLIALISGALFLITGMLPTTQFLSAIDFGVLFMMIGTMGLVSLFIESKMPLRLADIIMQKVPNVQIAVVSLALFAGIISAFVDNVATVLMIAPVGIVICKKLKINPIPFIISIAVSSNLQGAATLVGDTTAIMLGSATNMSFADFFLYEGKPSMFFIVETGAVCSVLILAFLFRKEKKAISHDMEITKVTNYIPTALLIETILLLVITSFIPDKPDITNGVICLVSFLCGLIFDCIKDRSANSFIPHIKNIDYQTLGLLVGLFLMIGGIKNMGVIDVAANLLTKLGGNNMFVLYSDILIVSVLISAFVDNIPYVATMLPIISGIATQLGMDATPLYFGLLSGATLGGNLTPIGASANIVGLGILRKEGYEVETKDFLKIGIPFTLSAVIPSYILIWAFYGI